MAPSKRTELITMCLDSASVHVFSGLCDALEGARLPRIERDIVEALAALESALALVRTAPTLRLVQPASDDDVPWKKHEGRRPRRNPTTKPVTGPFQRERGR